MNIHLALQSTYHDFECALMQESRLLATVYEPKQTASKNFTFMLERLLKNSNLRLSDISYSVVNRGPAPFTSLRVVLAAAKGIQAATALPVVGVDGLEVFLKEYAAHQPAITVALLNAFGNDVYFGIRTSDSFETGCASLTTVIDQLRKNFPTSLIHFIGNSAVTHRPHLEETFHERAVFPNPIPEYPSIQAIGAAGNALWSSGEYSATELIPLYLKNTL